MKPRIDDVTLPSGMFSLVLALCLGAACAPSADEPHDSHGSHEAHGNESEAGHEEHEPGHIRLTQDQYRSAGIEVMPVGPGKVSELLNLPGSVVPNADAVFHVTPRVAGQIRQVTRHLGDHVEAGEVLCVLDSVEIGEAAADYVRDRAMVEAADETLRREAELFERRIAALIETADRNIEVHRLIHEREERLQEKAMSTVRPVLEADKALQNAILDKRRQLTAIESERDTRLLALEVDARAKRIDLDAARNRLLTLGIASDEISGLQQGSPLLAGEYPVRSAGRGVIVDRHASPGEYVSAGAEMFVVQDLSNVWFVASAFEEQLRVVETGQPAFVSLDAFPDAAFEGQVSFLASRVDPVSRSCGVRIQIDNRRLESWPVELPLRPGMFGHVELETASRSVALVLPEKALVHDDLGDYVFVQEEPLEYARKNVVTAPAAGGMVEVLEGLENGDQVVIAGAFLLKSAERQGELGGGHSH